jgi:hypothetical protein
VTSSSSTDAPPRAGGIGSGRGGETTGERRLSSSISRSVAPAARSRSPYTSESTATLPTEDDHVDDRLPEVAGADVAAQHRLRALVQAPEQGAEGGADDEGDHERAQRRAPDRGAEGALGRLAEADRLAPSCR